MLTDIQNVSICWAAQRNPQDFDESIKQFTQNSYPHPT